MRYVVVTAVSVAIVIRVMFLLVIFLGFMMFFVSIISQFLSFAIMRSSLSGFTTRGFPTVSNSGRSVIESEYA